MANIKECFISRFLNGVIIEADYHQMEVAGVAVLSGDPTLKDDATNKDMHCVNAALLSGDSYTAVHSNYINGDPRTKKLRTSAKGPGFLIQYGGGAATMAAQTGLSKAACKKFIKSYYARYPLLKKWQDANLLAVEASRVSSGKRSPEGLPLGRGFLRSKTGRLYSFLEGPAPEYANTPTSFKPTEIKNYPSQGFATGDIIGEMCGILFRKIRKTSMKGHLLMINTVHDSLVFDCDILYATRAINFIRRTLEDAPGYIKARFGIDFDVPLKIEIKVGPTWGDAVIIE